MCLRLQMILRGHKQTSTQPWVNGTSGMFPRLSVTQVEKFLASWCDLDLTKGLASKPVGVCKHQEGPETILQLLLTLLNKALYAEQKRGVVMM